jgi:hypothetical protein
MAVNPGPDMEQDVQLAALYRSGADAQPPAHLDDAIRAAARREVAAGPRRAAIRRWTVPVSLAAVLVLSVSVVTMMREQGADRTESMIQPPAQAPATRMHSEIVQKESAETPATVAQETAAKRQPVAPPPAEVQAAPAAQVEAPAPAPALSVRPAEAERGVTDSRAKVMAAESNRAEDPAVARREYAAPQPMLRSAPAPMADAASGAGVSAAKPAAPVGALSAAPARSALWQDLVKEAPEKWLQRIAELRRAGQTADADTLLVEFRRRFPEVRLPEDPR